MNATARSDTKYMKISPNTTARKNGPDPSAVDLGLPVDLNISPDKADKSMVANENVLLLPQLKPT